MKTLLINNRWALAGIALGAAAGFAYWYFIGCVSGTCPITSRWHNATAYGALMGFVLFHGHGKKPAPPAAEN